MQFALLAMTRYFALPQVEGRRGETFIADNGFQSILLTLTNDVESFDREVVEGVDETGVYQRLTGRLWNFEPFNA